MQKAINAIKRLKDSPTFNTWLSYSTRALSLFIVLPLILKQFSEAEVALWYLFSTIIALQGLVDMGFKMTFVRLLSYAAAGADSIEVTTLGKASSEETSEKGPNLTLLGKILSTMKTVYFFLTIVFVVLISTAGTWSMLKPIKVVEDQQSAWIGWIVIVLISSLRFYGNIYSNYMEGMNKIALVRRWEALTSIGAILTSIVFLIVFKSLLSLVIANQVWVGLGVVRNFFLSQRIEGRLLERLKTRYPFDKDFFATIWQPAWRSGLSGLMSNGLSNITSILYAQVGSTGNVAAYLLALRLMAQVKEVSMAPFYSKIPTFARYNSMGKRKELIEIAQKGMFLSNMVFVVGVIITGVCADTLLSLVGSKVQFISQELWLTLTVAYFVHRYGAMHIQLYSTTNHIISHLADGVSGILYVISAYLLIDKIGLYAIPVGMLIGYLGFYSWFAALYSYRALNVGFYQFEKRASLIPAILIAVYTVHNLI